MRNAILVAVIAATGFSSAALAQGKKIGVSWASFQEERWKIDEAAMVAAIEAEGNTYISADAQSSSAKQLTDIEALIAQGADALIIQTEWREFKALDFNILREELKSPVVFDGRNLFSPSQMAARGFVYHSIGRRPVL